MNFDIDLYLNSCYCGFWPLDTIQEYYYEYYQKADALSEYIDWDEVILYAIYCYDEESEALISVDFMILRMDYSKYVDLAKKIARNCRLFFVRNK